MIPIRTNAVRVAALLGALVAIGMPACGGRSNGPIVGGESHFLSRCVDSCPGDLSCISGVCTTTCIVGDEGPCHALSAGALCTNASVEPGAVAICDYACTNDHDCSALGDHHGCSGGYCRAPAQADVGNGGTGALGASGEGDGATGGSEPGMGGTLSAGGSSAGKGGVGTGAAGTGAAGTGGSGTGAMGSGAIGGAAPVCETTIITDSEKNYEVSSTLTVSMTKVKPSSEITVDWSGVTADLLGRPVDLDNVGMVEMSLWEMSVGEFEHELNNDTLANPIMIADIRPLQGETSGSVFDLNVPSGPIDQGTVLNYLDATNYPPANHMYAFMVANGYEYGRGTYMLAAMQLDPASTNTRVTIDLNSSTVAVGVNIASHPPTYVPAGRSDLVIDWTKQKTTASGGEFIPSSITQLRIGMYDQSIEELEADFLQLDEIAVEMYEAPVLAGTSFNLSKASTKDGKPFAGIDADHTWLVALNCGACQNPAPWYLSVLKPCPGVP